MALGCQRLLTLGVQDVSALLVKKWSVVSWIISCCNILGVPLQLGAQLVSNAVSRVVVAKEIDVHTLARRRVEEAQYALIHGAKWHESLVKDTVASAKELPATGVGSIWHPAKPAFLARVKAKAQVDARQASRR